MESNVQPLSANLSNQSGSGV